VFNSRRYDIFQDFSDVVGGLKSISACHGRI